MLWGNGTEESILPPLSPFVPLSPSHQLLVFTMFVLQLVVQKPKLGIFKINFKYL